MTSILTAFRFLTVIPLGRGGKTEPRDMADAMAWFPAVGLALGMLLYLCDRIFQHFLRQPVADVLLISILVLVTGALHLDGFADTLDGISGGRGDRERMLAIMKDSRTGAVGVVGLVLLLLLKYAALGSVGWNYRAAALITMPVISRWTQVITAFGAQYARKEGSLAQPFVEHIEMRQFLIATITVAVVSVIAAVKAASPVFLLVVAASGAFTLAARYYFTRRIGGITGDTIGAVSETVEVLVLVALVVAG